MSSLNGIAAAVAMGCALATGAVRADDVEDYSFYLTAASLDDLCHALKYMEREAMRDLADEELRQTSQNAQYVDQRLSFDEYDAWLDGITAAATAKADEIGCTQGAQSYLLTARAAATGRLYQDMLIAFELATLAEDESARVNLTPDQKQAAQVFDAFVQQLYGSSYATFRENQRQAALKRVPASFSDEARSSQYFMGETFGLDEEQTQMLLAARRAAENTVELVHFEVAAETAGLLVWPTTFQGEWHAPALMDAKAGQLRAVVFEDRYNYRVEGGGETYGAFALSAEGKLRFMSYGTAATERLTDGAVRLLVRTAPVPRGVAAGDVFERDDWRALATAYEGGRIDDRCLGGPCFEFPDEALAAIQATDFYERAELWLSPDVQATPPETSSYYQRNILYPALLRRHEGEVPPA
jgi:hypothetical protein